VLTKTGRPIDKGYLYKLLANRTYIGDAPHKGMIHKGEHAAIVPLDLWNRVHAMLQVSPRTKANQNRSQTPALLRGLIFGIDGRAMSPVHTLRRGRQYRYYVSQSVLKGAAIDDPSLVRRIAAAEIEDAVMAQVRALLRQPEIIVGTWRAAQADAPGITEAETREALESLDPMWDELFPGEQARIVKALVDRVTVGPAGVDIRLKVEGLTGLVQDLAPQRRVREAA